MCHVYNVPTVLNLLTCVAITCHVDLGLYPADGLVVREEILVYRLLLSLDLSHMVPQSLQTKAHLRGRGDKIKCSSSGYIALRRNSLIPSPHSSTSSAVTLRVTIVVVLRKAFA